MLFGVILAQHINSKSLPEDIDNNNASSLDDVFMPKDDAVNASDIVHVNWKSSCDFAC